MAASLLPSFASQQEVADDGQPYQTEPSLSAVSFDRHPHRIRRLPIHREHHIHFTASHQVARNQRIDSKGV
jgi:hypothetical protein